MSAKWRLADSFPALPDQSPVIGIEMALEPLRHASDGAAGCCERLLRHGQRENRQELVAKHQRRISDIGRQPAFEAMAARRFRCGDILTALQALARGSQ